MFPSDASGSVLRPLRRTRRDHRGTKPNRRPRRTWRTDRWSAVFVRSGRLDCSPSGRSRRGRQLDPARILARSGATAQARCSPSTARGRADQQLGIAARRVAAVHAQPASSTTSATASTPPLPRSGGRSNSPGPARSTPPDRERAFARRTATARDSQGNGVSPYQTIMAPAGAPGRATWKQGRSMSSGRRRGHYDMTYDVRDVAGAHHHRRAGRGCVRRPRRPREPPGSYETTQRVAVFDPSRAISQKPGHDFAGDGKPQFGGWTWRNDLVATQPSDTEVTLTEDWTAVAPFLREHLTVPLFPRTTSRTRCVTSRIWSNSPLPTALRHPVAELTNTNVSKLT